METTASLGVFWLAFAQAHKGDQPLLPIRFRSFVRHGPKSDALPPCLKTCKRILALTAHSVTMFTRLARTFTPSFKCTLLAT